MSDIGSLKSCRSLSKARNTITKENTYDINIIATRNKDFHNFHGLANDFKSFQKLVTRILITFIESIKVIVAG